MLHQSNGYLAIKKGNNHILSVKSTTSTHRPVSTLSLLHIYSSSSCLHVINLVNTLTTALCERQALPPVFKKSDCLINNSQVTDCTYRNTCLVGLKNLNSSWHSTTSQSIKPKLTRLVFQRIQSLTVQSSSPYQTYLNQPWYVIE